MIHRMIRRSAQTLAVLAACIVLAGCESPRNSPAPILESDAPADSPGDPHGVAAPTPRDDSSPPPSDPPPPPHVAPAPDPSAAPPTESEPPLTAISNAGSFVVECVPEPSPIPMNALFRLRVRVLANDAQRAPPRDVRVEVDAAMPEHGHGMNLTPRVIDAGGGQYLADGMLLHMPGYWEIYVDVSRGGVTERAQFEVNLE